MAFFTRSSGNVRYGIDMRISAPSTQVSNVFNGSLGRGASSLARLEVKLPEMPEALDNSTIKGPFRQGATAMRAPLVRA